MLHGAIQKINVALFMDHGVVLLLLLHSAVSLHWLILTPKYNTVDSGVVAGHFFSMSTVPQDVTKSCERHRGGTVLLQRHHRDNPLRNDPAGALI